MCGLHPLGLPLPSAFQLGSAMEVLAENWRRKREQVNIDSPVSSRLGSAAMLQNRVRDGSPALPGPFCCRDSGKLPAVGWAGVLPSVGLLARHRHLCTVCCFNNLALSDRLVSLGSERIVADTVTWSSLHASPQQEH